MPEKDFDHKEIKNKRLKIRVIECVLSTDDLDIFSTQLWKQDLNIQTKTKSIRPRPKL